MSFNFSHCHNFSGGFWNALLNWHQWDRYPLYMQIEQGNLCFKISTHPEDTGLGENDDHTIIRNSCYHALLSEAHKEGLTEIKKPRRFGKGTYMTVALVEQEVWLGTKDQIIDIDTTLSNLRKYELFLERFINDWSKL